MSSGPSIDGVLVEWGERLFNPKNRIVKATTPRLPSTQGRAAAIRSRIAATVRRAPQVMVKVTGAGRGMAAIAAHFRYISKNGRLPIEDDRGVVEQGSDALRDIERQWQFGGAYIGDEGTRREAFNVMLSMPRGTDPLIMQRAGREFAKVEFSDHRYVMVLHDHQANPHVHLSVKAMSKHGQRLNPRKADLHRWRETFAERLREWGVDAEASRQATRGLYRSQESLWRIKAREDGRLRMRAPPTKTGVTGRSQEESLEAWKQIAMVLGKSAAQQDRLLAEQIIGFVRGAPLARNVATPQLKAQRAILPQTLTAPRHAQSPELVQSRGGPEIQR